MVFPSTAQVTQLLKNIDGTNSTHEIMAKLGLTHREYFRKTYLNPAIEGGLVVLTIPNKPKSSKQRYKLTAKAKAFLQKEMPQN